MVAYHLILLIQAVLVNSAVDKYVGICGRDSVHKDCFVRSTLSKMICVVDRNNSIPLCPSGIEIAESFEYSNGFNLYPFSFDYRKANLSIFFPQDSNALTYDLQPFNKISGTTFILLTECFLKSCTCVVINIKPTTVEITNKGGTGLSLIETVPRNMQADHTIYTMTNALEMIVLTGTREQLSDTYLSSNDSIAVFCVGNSISGTRGLLQLSPLPSTTPQTAPSPYRTLPTRSVSSQSSDRYLAMVGVTAMDELPPDWRQYVLDFNQTLNYNLMVVQWSNVSGLVLTSQTIYENYTFHKAEFTYRRLGMLDTTIGISRFTSPAPPKSSNGPDNSQFSSVHKPYTYVVGMCTYMCDSEVLPVNTSDPVQRQMLERQLHELRTQLTVNKTQLSSTRRRKESAFDHRVSAKAFGFVGTAILCICFGIVILADLSKLSKALLDFRAQVCEPDVVQVKPAKIRRPSRVRKQSHDKLVPFISRRNRVSSETSI